MTSQLAWVRIGLAACLLAVPVARATAASDGWEQLKSMAGDWEAKTSESPDPVRVSYRVIANDSAVVETLHVPTHEMITVYHRDGDSLMATHYCAAGNQPRMRAKPALSAPKRLEFRFVDATNLRSPDAVHMSDLTITFEDADHVKQEWTSRERGKDSVAVFRLARKR